MPDQPQSYQQTHHRAVTAAHGTRTAEVDGAFILSHLQSHFKILDIGCGPGSITSGFARYVPQGHVTGIDLTTQVISEATERLSQLNPSPTNVSFQTGNVLDGLDFPDASFDVVFCSQTLVHIVEPIKALKEMKRVCKPGGFVAAREGDMPFRWVPYPRGLQLFNKYLYVMVMGDIGVDSEHPDNAPFKEGHRSGSLVHVWGREAGFEPLKMVKGAKVTMYATPEEREYVAGNYIGRFDQAGWRDKYIAAGASAEDVDNIVADLKKWKEDVDGWHAVMQCETICWN
jgi:SAM-dependent methyltransferase